MEKMIEITDFTAPGLDVYARLSEAELSHFYEPNGGLFIAESPMIVERALDAGYEPVSLLAERSLLNALPESIEKRCDGIPVFTADFAVLSQLTGFPLTRGLLCAMRRPLPQSAENICRTARRIAVLENVMNPTNVGAIFRSAAALGMDAVCLQAVL